MTWQPAGRSPVPVVREDPAAESSSTSTPTTAPPVNAPSKEESSETGGFESLVSLTDRIRNLADQIHQDLQEADRTGG